MGVHAAPPAQHFMQGHEQGQREDFRINPALKAVREKAMTDLIARLRDAVPCTGKRCQCDLLTEAATALEAAQRDARLGAFMRDRIEPQANGWWIGETWVDGAPSLETIDDVIAAQVKP